MFLIAIFYILDIISQEEGNDYTLCVLRWEAAGTDSHLRSSLFACLLVCLEKEDVSMGDPEVQKKRTHLLPPLLPQSQFLKLKDGEWVAIYPPEVSGAPNSGTEVQFPPEFVSVVKHLQKICHISISQCAHLLYLHGKTYSRVETDWEFIFPHAYLVCTYLLALQGCDDVGGIAWATLQKTWLLTLFILWQGLPGIMQMIVLYKL